MSCLSSTLNLGDGQLQSLPPAKRLWLNCRLLRIFQVANLSTQGLTNENVMFCECQLVLFVGRISFTQMKNFCHQLVHGYVGVKTFSWESCAFGLAIVSSKLPRKAYATFCFLLKSLKRNKLFELQHAS